jgi:hypothetical protein
MSTKFSALSALTSMSADDIVPVVDDPGGTPITKKITRANLMASLDLTGAGVANVGASNVIGGVMVVHRVLASDPITDAIDLNVSDKVVKRPTTIDDAFHEIAAAGTLRITGASAVNAQVYVIGMRVA